jgi:ribosome-associated toxin RatA of RatAB toxin-antitoxin module
MAVWKIKFTKEKTIGSDGKDRSSAVKEVLSFLNWKNAEVVDVVHNDGDDRDARYTVTIKHLSTRFVNANSKDEAISKIKKSLRKPSSFELLDAKRVYGYNNNEQNSDLAD